MSFPCFRGGPSEWPSYSCEQNGLRAELCLIPLRIIDVWHLFKPFKPLSWPGGGGVVVFVVVVVVVVVVQQFNEWAAWLLNATDKHHLKHYKVIHWMVLRSYDFRF